MRNQYLMDKISKKKMKVIKRIKVMQLKTKKISINMKIEKKKKTTKTILHQTIISKVPIKKYPSKNDTHLNSGK